MPGYIKGRRSEEQFSASVRTPCEVVATMPVVVLMLVFNWLITANMNQKLFKCVIL